MFNFLKKIFRTELKIPVENVELDSLGQWFDEKTKPKIEELNIELKKVNEQVSQKVLETKQSLDALNKAELMNPNIPERAKHFMKGNREAYTKKVNSFLDAVCPPQTVENLPVFHSAVQKELKELTQGTVRSFQILQEFFANESRKVMAGIGGIEKEINLFKQAFDDAGLNVLNDTKQQIIDFQTKIKLKNALENDLDEKQKEIKSHTAEITKLKADIKMLQQDRELNELKNKLKNLQVKGEAARERITTPFSVINHALKKFERITYRHRTIVQKYIESPLDALMQDLHLGILKALHDLEMAIANNRIDVRNKKKDKTLEVLKLLTKEYLGNFLTEYGHIKHEQDRLKKQIANLDVVVLLKQKKERIQKLENERIDIERKIDMFSKERSKVNIEELESKLVENLKKITNTNVTLLK